MRGKSLARSSTMPGRKFGHAGLNWKVAPSKPFPPAGPLNVRTKAPQAPGPVLPNSWGTAGTEKWYKRKPSSASLSLSCARQSVANPTTTAADNSVRQMVDARRVVDLMHTFIRRSFIDGRWCENSAPDFYGPDYDSRGG